MAEGLLHVAVSHLDGVALLTVRGDIDADSVAVLQAVLDELAVETTIRIDMADVRFMDSSGINAILAHTVRMADGQGSITICQPSTAVRRVVEMTGLETLLVETQTKKAVCLEDYQGDRNGRPSLEALDSFDSKGLVDEDVA